ncbi:hypothetical protein Save01_07908 [Streptomyces avermitilis]
MLALHISNSKLAHESYDESWLRKPVHLAILEKEPVGIRGIRDVELD